MAYDDFAPTPLDAHSPSPEDEDLFNFPAADTTAPPTPVATTTTKVGSNAPTTSTAEHVIDGDHAAIAAAERLIEDLEEVMGDELDAVPQAPSAPAPKSNPAPPQPVAKTSQAAPASAPVPVSAATSTSDDDVDDDAPAAKIAEPVRARTLRDLPRAVWIAVGGLVCMNALAFVVLWQSTRSSRSGLESLRDELAVTLHEVRANVDQTASSTEPSPSATAHTPTDEVPAPRAKSTTPLAPFEETTLSLARQEIDAGEFTAARKRLYKLLAVADRIDAELRAGIEAQAEYAIGDSYRRQAAARREARP